MFGPPWNCRRGSTRAVWDRSPVACLREDHPRRGFVRRRAPSVMRLAASLGRWPTGKALCAGSPIIPTCRTPRRRRRGDRFASVSVSDPHHKRTDPDGCRRRGRNGVNNPMTRKSLSDILREGDRQSLSRAWGETRPPKISRRCRRANTSPGSSAGNCSPARRRARPGTSWPSASWRATTRAGNSGMTFG